MSFLCACRKAPKRTNDELKDLVHFVTWRLAEVAKKNKQQNESSFCRFEKWVNDI